MTNLAEQIDEARALRGIHGDGNCHICGKPKVAKGSPVCSYPHAMLPDKEISPGMWSWRVHGELTPGDRVEKVSGYKWPGIVVASFLTTKGQHRLVVECLVPEVAGALHIYAPEQLRIANEQLTPQRVTDEKGS